MELDIEELKRVRKEGFWHGKIVVTNGVFDIIHAPHLRMLEKASKLGEILIVGINSDRAVKNLKGKNRPINNEMDRKFHLECIKFVDYVFIFDNESCEDFLKYIKPDVYVKSSDYSLDNMNKKELSVLKEIGAEIKFVNYEKGISTSSIIEKIKNL